MTSGRPNLRWLLLTAVGWRFSGRITAGQEFGCVRWIRATNRISSSPQQSSTYLKCRFCLRGRYCLRRRQVDARLYLLGTRQALSDLLAWRMRGTLLSLRTAAGSLTVSLREGTGISGCAI